MRQQQAFGYVLHLQQKPPEMQPLAPCLPVRFDRPTKEIFYSNDPSGFSYNTRPIRIPSSDLYPMPMFHFHWLRTSTLFTDRRTRSMNGMSAFHIVTHLILIHIHRPSLTLHVLDKLHH